MVESSLPGGFLRLRTDDRNLERGGSYLNCFPVREGKPDPGHAVGRIFRNPHGAVKEAASAAAQRERLFSSFGASFSGEFDLE